MESSGSVFYMRVHPLFSDTLCCLSCLFQNLLSTSFLSAMPSLMCQPSANVHIRHPLLWCILPVFAVLPCCFALYRYQVMLHSAITSFSGLLVPGRLMGDGQQGAVLFELALIVAVSIPLLCYSNDGWPQLLFRNSCWLLMMQDWVILICCACSSCYDGVAQKASCFWMRNGWPGRVTVVAICNGSFWMILYLGLRIGRGIVVTWFSSSYFGKVAQAWDYVCMFSYLVARWGYSPSVIYFQLHVFVAISLLVSYSFSGLCFCQEPLDCED